MGSSGSGRITDYPGSSATSGSSGGGDGDSGGADRCAKAFSVKLEDVELSDYFKKHQRPPPVGAQVEVARAKRLFAQIVGGDSVGNIPTSHNYLAACFRDGWTYVGTVRTSISSGTGSSVQVDFAAVRP